METGEGKGGINITEKDASGTVHFKQIWINIVMLLQSTNFIWDMLIEVSYIRQGNNYSTLLRNEEVSEGMFWAPYLRKVIDKTENKMKDLFPLRKAGKMYLFIFNLKQNKTKNTSGDKRETEL